GRRRHTRSKRDWSSDVCSSDLDRGPPGGPGAGAAGDLLPAGAGPPGAARASCRGVRPAANRQRAGHHHLQRADRPGLPRRDLRGGAGDDERGDPGDRLGVHRRPAARASPARTAGRARWVRTGTGMSTDEASVSPLVRRICYVASYELLAIALTSVGLVVLGFGRGHSTVVA